MSHTTIVWDKKMDASDEKLAEEVRRHPNLYNLSIRAHKNARHSCSKSWREIAQTLGKEEQACRYRWKIIRDRYVRAKKAAKGECDDADSVAKAPILRTLGWLSTHVSHRETANMPSLDVKPEMPAQALLRLQESEVDSQQALGHQEESNQLLRQQLNEMRKRLEDKENKLTEANEIIRVLRNEVQTLQQQLELQRREYQDIIGQRAQMGQCIKQTDELKTSVCQDPCMQASSVTSDGHDDLDPNHTVTDAESSPQRSHEDQEPTAQRSPLKPNCLLSTATYMSPPNMFLSCTSEDDPPVDLPVSISNGTVTSPQQVPLRVVTVNLKDCREMLGPNGVYKIPTEDGFHGHEGSCGYDQLDVDDEDDDDDDYNYSGSGEGEGDSDYDPRNKGLIQTAHQRSHGEKTLNPLSLCESKGQRQRKSHECSECGEVFPSLSRLLVHQKMHRRGKTSERKTRKVNSHECSECGKLFLSPSQLSIHQRVHDKTKPLTDTHVETETTVEEHDGIPKEPCEEIHKKTQKIHQCDKCGKILSCVSTLNAHKKIHSGERPHVCTQCGRAFTLLGNLKAHYKIHAQDRRFECSHCLKRFLTSSHLKLHIRRHTGEKPYSCTDCGKNFSCSSSLRSHRKSHSEERPFLCLQCGYTFKHKYGLTLHEARHTREKRKLCPYCNKSFEMYYLKRHMRAHTGERPYKCSECGEAFALRSYLNNHKLRHTGERPHLCSVCGKTFARVHVLKTHQRVHTGEKPFRCPVCGERFSYVQTLHSHQKREHGDGPSHKCSQCGDGFETAKELKSHECVQGGNEKTLEEVVEEAVNSL